MVMDVLRELVADLPARNTRPERIRTSRSWMLLLLVLAVASPNCADRSNRACMLSGQSQVPAMAESNCGIWMPIDPESNLPANVAVYTVGSPRLGKAVCRQTVVAFWASGRVIWSQDPITGGPPYRIGSIEPDKLAELQNRLRALHFFEARSIYGTVIVDGGYTVFAACYGGLCSEQMSSHELYERNADVVVMDGALLILSERQSTRQRMLALSSEGNQRFRAEWKMARGILSEYLPQPGQSSE
jgi:hypothetical protein